ncbi:MAG: hypothetical protein PHP37_02595 [Patescibacteria group bacterium]|nr:hypothetical protein [Patescibacteria group bacterium]
MEKSKLKKMILVLGFLIFVILMGILLWKTFFSKEDTSELPIEQTIDPVTGLPLSPDGSGQVVDDLSPGIIEDSSKDAPQSYPVRPQIPSEINSTAIGGVTKTTTLVSDSSLKPTLSEDGNSIQFYNQSDGKFYIVNDKGDLIALSDKVFHNVSNIEWAPNKSKAILEYPDGNKIIYDFNTEKQVTLPKHWEDFSFSPDSSKLVNKSLGTDPDNRWLIVSNSDGSQSKAVEFIGTNDKSVISSWSPNNQIIGMYTQGIDFNRREVFFIGQNDENFKSITVEGWGFEGKWSQTGNQLLYSVYSPNDDLKPKLWIVNSSGDNIGVNRTNLQLETWAEKCNFASANEIYCAVPNELPKGAGLYPELAENSYDNLYKINLQTGQKELIAIPDNFYNISSLIINKDQSTAFFTDNITGQIHKIDLQ